MNYLVDILILTESDTPRAEGIYSLPKLTPGVLYITDSPSIATALLDRNYPTVIYSHSENQNMIFPHTKYVLEDIDEIDDDDLERIYRRVCGIPWDILETKRLLVRETTLDDIDTLFDLYSHPSITEYMEDLFPLREEIDYQRKYIENIYGLYEIGMWSVLLKDSGQMIGRMGIEYREDSSTVELGFMLGITYQGYGYAFEACTAIIDYARTIDGVKRIIANVHKNNTPSVQLCERLGMKCIGQSEHINTNEKKNKHISDYNVWEYIFD